MRADAIFRITERLRLLPVDKLDVVYDFVSYLAEKELRQRVRESESVETMLASESVLRRDWDLPDENEAWS